VHCVACVLKICDSDVTMVCVDELDGFVGTGGLLYVSGKNGSSVNG
jgi:hypothetical protein